MFNFLRRKKEGAVLVKTYSIEEYETVLTEKAKIIVEKENLLKDLAESQKTCNIIASERDKLKTMVREQTEADLLINILKGLGIIPKPVQYDAFKEQERLLTLQQQANAFNTSQYGHYSSLSLSRLGELGGLFSYKK